MFNFPDQETLKMIFILIIFFGGIAYMFFREELPDSVKEYYIKFCCHLSDEEAMILIKKKYGSIVIDHEDVLSQELYSAYIRGQELFSFYSNNRYMKKDEIIKEGFRRLRTGEGCLCL